MKHRRPLGVLRLLGALILLAACPTLGWAQDDDLPPLTVGVKSAPPFVLVSEDGDVRGLSVDLIREIARRLDPPREIKFVLHPDLRTHLSEVKSAEVDMGIAATTITREREVDLDFSLPFHSSGLGIVTRPQESSSVWQLLVTRDNAITLLGALVFIVVCAHLIWVVERKGGAFDRTYLKGVFEAAWWTVVTMSTVGYGDYVPKRAFSKVLGLLIIVSGIVLFGLAVASITSAVTVQELRSEIEGPDDLVGRPVAVLENTTSAAAMIERRARPKPVATLDDALDALEAGEVDAVVHDLPILRYHLAEHPRAGLSLLTHFFNRQAYAITLPTKSELRKPINLALLAIKEDHDLYLSILRRWLGDTADI